MLELDVEINFMILFAIIFFGIIFYSLFNINKRETNIASYYQYIYLLKHIC